MQRSGNHKKMLVWYLWSLRHNDTVLVLLASQNGIAWGSAFSSSVWGNRNFQAGSSRLLSDCCNIYIQTVYFMKKLVVKLPSILPAVPGESQPSSGVMWHNLSPSLEKPRESFKIRKLIFSAIGNVQYKYLKGDKLDSMQAQANLLKIMFHSSIGLRIAKKENQVAEFWCGHSDTVLQVFPEAQAGV